MAVSEGEHGKCEHPYRRLSGEALTNHLMAQHDWDMRMVAIRAESNPVWTANMHEWAHDPEMPA